MFMNMTFLLALTFVCGMLFGLVLAALAAIFTGY